MKTEIENFVKTLKDQGIPFRKIFFILQKDHPSWYQWVVDTSDKKLTKRQQAKKLFSALHDGFSFICPHGNNIELTENHNLKFPKNMLCGCKDAYLSSVEYENKKNESIKKQKESCVKKYGSTCPLSNVEINKKRKASMIERYGVEYSGQNKKLHQKSIDTLKRNLGVEFPYQNKEIFKKAQKTFKKNFEFGYKDVKILGKKRKTSFNLYGVDHHSKRESEKVKIGERIKSLWENKDWKEKQINKISLSCQKKYNRTFPAQIHFSEKAWTLLNDREQFLEELKHFGVYETSKKYTVGIMTLYRYCNLYDPTFLKTSISSYQIEIETWLKTVGFNFECRNRKVLNGKELDFYFPTEKIAIEFQGDFWHGNPLIYDALDVHPIKKKTYLEIWKDDLFKIELAKQKDILLFWIWEMDWNLNKEIVKKYILEQLKHK